MRHLIKTTLLLSQLAWSVPGFSQANHWAIAPNISFNANTGVASYFSTSGLDLTGCITPNKVIGVQSGPSVGSPFFAFSNCGVYNSSGTAVGPGALSATFPVPGLCNNFYSVGWVSVWGPPHTNKLVINLYDASTPSSVTLVSSADIIYGLNGLSVAASPMKADGSRTVYVSNDMTLSSFTIAANGTIGAISTLASLPTDLDVRTTMEVTPDGKSIIMLFLGTSIKRYDIASGTFTTIGTPGTVVSGFEFVPGSQFGAGAHDRLYVSYHNWATPAGYGNLGYYDLDNLPAGVTTVTSSIPAGTAAAGFGYSEIERAKNGKLYLAYNPKYWPNGFGYYDMPNNGTLHVLDPVAGTITGVTIGGTAVPIRIDGAGIDWGYFIQNQVDGDNYNYVNWNTGTSNFTVNKKGNEDPFTTPYGFVPTVWYCNDDTTNLMLRAEINGFITGRIIKVEKGTVTWDALHSPIFTPSGTTYTSSTLSGTFTKDSANILSLFPALLGYYGDIRVSYITTGCGANATRSKLFLLRSAKALINFGIQGPPSASCPSGGVQSRKILSTAFGTHGTVAAAFCDSGWLGASSAALLNGTSTLTGATAADSYRVSIEGPGLSITKAYSTMPTSLTFTTLTDGYFLFSYAAAKGGPVFKITAYVKTSQCDTVSAHSYFKIIDGGPAFSPGNFWRSNDLQLEEVHVFPNPATDKVQLFWHSNSAGAASIALVDIFGKRVLQQNLPQSEGQNDLQLDISSLVPGVYHYILQTGNGELTGRILKQ